MPTPRTFTFPALALLTVFALLGAVLPDTLSAQEGATLIRDARIFDGDRVIEARDVLIDEGRIVRVGTGLEAPAGAVVVEAAGRTLMPGLIDAHTHTFGEGLSEALVFGVTTHLDMLTDLGLAHAMRSEQEAGLVTSRADLFSAGALVTAPGGHGTQFGIPIPTLASADSAQAFVDARLAEGSDWIKIVHDDFHAYGMSMPTLDAEAVRAVVEATRRRGRLAVVHVGYASGARMAIEANAHGLAHLFTDRLPESDFAATVAEQGAFVIPTLTVLQSIAGSAGGESLIDDERFAPYLHPNSRTMLRNAYPVLPGGPARSYDVARETVRQLHAAGVPILAGTDAPNPGTAYGSAMHRELELLVDAGLSPEEALTAATAGPARIFGLDDRGRIAPGLRADLLLVDGDPTRDITATRDIAGIWKSGVPVDRAPYARQVAAALEAATRTVEELVDGLVSDFETGAMEAVIGSWMESPDNFAGGNSTGTVEVVEGGADGSGRALRIAGTIGDAVPFAWYGAMWSPGEQPMSPVDLSDYDGLSFWTRGDGGTYRIMIFAQSRGMVPIEKTFETGEEWRRFVFHWSDFGIEGDDVMGLVFAGGPSPGPFGFVVDQLRLSR